MWKWWKKLTTKQNITKLGDDMVQDTWVKVMFVDMTPVGSLQIFGICTSDQAKSNADLSNKIYWTDYLATQPIGPFINVYEATQSHVKTVLTRKAYKDQILYGNTPAFPEVSPTSNALTVTPKDNIINIQDYKASKMKFNKPKVNR